MAAQAALLTLLCAGGEMTSEIMTEVSPALRIAQKGAGVLYMPAVSAVPIRLSHAEAVGMEADHDVVIVRLDPCPDARHPVTLDLIMRRRLKMARRVGSLPCLGLDGSFYAVPAFGDYGAVRLGAAGIELLSVWPFDEPGDCDMGIASAARLFRDAVWGC